MTQNADTKIDWNCPRCPQSYAGKYVPAIGYYIHKHNPIAKVKINFKGVAIGDGLCDPELVGCVLIHCDFNFTQHCLTLLI